jgi:hypothetical protein
MYSINLSNASKKLKSETFTFASEYEYNFSRGETRTQKASFVLNIIMIASLILLFPFYYVIGMVPLLLPFAIVIVERYVVYSPRKVLLEQYSKTINGTEAGILTTQKITRWILLGVSSIVLLAIPAFALGWSFDKIFELIGMF